jgi:hypothetical protein
MDVDPGRELAICTVCNAESFVKTATRPLPPQMEARYRSVIDLTPKRQGYLVAMVVMMVVASAGAWMGARRLVGSSSAPVQSSSASTAQVEVPAPRAPEVPSPPPVPEVPDIPSTLPLQAAMKEASLEESAVTGALPHEVIERVVRRNYGRFRACYEKGLRRNPKLEGRVAVRFVIGLDGRVTNAKKGESDIPDAAVVSCIVAGFTTLQFPAPGGGPVSVVYPIRFAPG